jgi:hypothetical protein
MLRSLEPILLNNRQNSLEVKEYSLNERLSQAATDFAKQTPQSRVFVTCGCEDERLDADLVLR